MLRVIPELYKKYVKGTEKGAIVQDVQVLICNLTSAVILGIQANCNRVYISTRVLKHVYDKRPAEEFDFLIDNVHQFIKYPTQIYRNRNGKKGDYCFIGEAKNNKYICSIEIKKDEQDAHSHCEVVTFFRIQKESYLDNYELVWEWKGGAPSS